MEISTFKDLRDFLNTLSEEQLNQEVRLQIIDSMSEPIKSAEITGEPDYLTEDGWAPIFTYYEEYEEEPLEAHEMRPAGVVLLFNE